MLSKVMYADLRPNLRTQTKWYIGLSSTWNKQLLVTYLCWFGIIRVVYWSFPHLEPRSCQVPKALEFHEVRKQLKWFFWVALKVYELRLLEKYIDSLMKASIHSECIGSLFLRETKSLRNMLRSILSQILRSTTTDTIKYPPHHHGDSQTGYICGSY